MDRDGKVLMYQEKMVRFERIKEGYNGRSELVAV